MRREQITEKKGGEERKDLGKYDKVASCSAADRRQHIWNTSVSWKMLREIRKEGFRASKSGEREGPGDDSLLCYSTPSLCLNFVSFCGWGTGLPPNSSLFLLPSPPHSVQMSHPAGVLGVSFSMSVSFVLFLVFRLCPSSAFHPVGLDCFIGV